jgi:uncharacterized membrane protein (UPF0182 family)
MDGLDFWIGVFATFLNCWSLHTLVLSFIRYFTISYLMGRVIELKVSRRLRMKGGRQSLATVFTVVVLGRLCLELVIWWIR